MDVSLTKLERLVRWVERHEKALLAAVLAYASIGFILKAHRRSFWFDEIFTFYIARLDDIRRMLQAAPADGQPPLYYGLAHLSQAILGPTIFATRLPSILAFIAALLCVYVFVRRRGPAVAALFAIAVIYTARIAYYGAEARPYAIMLFFTAFTLVSWQLAAERQSHRFWPLTCMALGIAGAIANHHFGVLSVGLPLAVGELWRLGKTRRLDLPLYFAGLLGAAMLIATFPLIAETNAALLQYVRTSSVFYGKANFGQLDAYTWMASLPVVGIFLVLSFLFAKVRKPRQQPSAAAAIPRHEIAAAAALCGLVPVMIAAAWLGTGYFQPRYAICSTIGIAILLGFAVSSKAPFMRGTSLAALVCLPLLWIGDLRTGLVLLRGRNPVKEYTTPAVLEPVPTDLPIVASRALEYPALWFYAPDALRKQIYDITDLKWALRQVDPLPELSLIGNKAFMPFNIEDYETFVRRHGAFYLYCSRDGQVDCPPDHTWLKTRLLAEGYRLATVRETPTAILYRVARE